MKIAQLEINGQATPVLLQPGGFQRIRTASISDFISGGEAGLELSEPESLDDTEFRWLPPITDPGKIICIGRNYAEHARESGSDVPDIPVVFNKFATALSPHQGDVVLPTISDEALTALDNMFEIARYSRQELGDSHRSQAAAALQRAIVEIENAVQMPATAAPATA